MDIQKKKFVFVKNYFKIAINSKFS